MQITEIEKLSNELKKLLPMKPEFQKELDKKFRLEFNYNSNHIEGNTLTYGETELLLIFGDTTGNHSMREYEEMKAHDVAYHLIEDWAKDIERPLTEQSIKNLNEVILVRPYWKEAITPEGQPTRRLIKVGDYKEFPNSVRLENGEIFNYTSPAETPILMNELIEWYRDEEKSLHPVTLAAMLHYKFVRIHPFDDGNGRIARLLMNYVLLRNGFPPIVIKSSEKQNYLSSLHFADIGNYEPLIEYIAVQLIWWLKISIKAAKGQNISENEDFDKEIEILKRKQFRPKEKLKKSKDVIRKISNDIYYPLILQLNTKLTKLDKLFEKPQWRYHLMPSKQGQSILPQFGTVNNLIKYFDSLANPEHHLYSGFNATYLLNKYNDQNNFSMEVSLQIYFELFSYKIRVFIGQPITGNFLKPLVAKTANSLTHLNSNKDYELINAEYNDIPFKDKINDYANQISNEILDFIKQKINKK
jgi:Fic family protein